MTDFIVLPGQHCVNECGLHQTICLMSHIMDSDEQCNRRIRLEISFFQDIGTSNNIYAQNDNRYRTSNTNISSIMKKI